MNQNFGQQYNAMLDYIFCQIPFLYRRQYPENIYDKNWIKINWIMDSLVPGLIFPIGSSLLLFKGLIIKFFNFLISCCAFIQKYSSKFPFQLVRSNELFRWNSSIAAFILDGKNMPFIYLFTFRHPSKDMFAFVYANYLFDILLS